MKKVLRRGVAGGNQGVSKGALPSECWKGRGECILWWNIVAGDRNCEGWLLSEDLEGHGQRGLPRTWRDTTTGMDHRDSNEFLHNFTSARFVDLASILKGARLVDDGWNTRGNRAGEEASEHNRRVKNRFRIRSQPTMWWQRYCMKPVCATLKSTHKLQRINVREFSTKVKNHVGTGHGWKFTSGGLKKKAFFFGTMSKDRKPPPTKILSYCSICSPTVGRYFTSFFLRFLEVQHPHCLLKVCLMIIQSLERAWVCWKPGGYAHRYPAQVVTGALPS